jgi:hypothetical protein
MFVLRDDFSWLPTCVFALLFTFHFWSLMRFGGAAL